MPWVTSGKFIDVFLIVYWYILVKVKQCETGKAFICPAVCCMRRGGAGSRPLSLAHSEERQLRITTNYFIYSSFICLSSHYHDKKNQSSRLCY